MSEAIATVLLVEDDGLVARAVCRQLEARGFEVLTVASWEHVIACVQSRRPDVVLMDVGLGGHVDGITIAEEIFVCEDTPVVLISGAMCDALSRRAAQCGAYAFLVKPTPIESIVATLELAMRKHEELRRRRAESRRLAQVVDAIDVAVIVLGRDGDVELMNRAAYGLTGARLGEAKVRRPEWAAQIDRTDASGSVQLRIGDDTIPCTFRRFGTPDGERVFLVERVVER
ncbi:MAG: response regulator [Labilithrix sp.]|nr:response regulator [Labilithrix sp.]MCW5810278.1 response regulator [Labilithrix sp.]